MLEIILIMLILAFSNAFSVYLGSKIAKRESILPEMFKKDDFKIYEPEEMRELLQTNGEGKIVGEEEDFDIR